MAHRHALWMLPLAVAAAWAALARAEDSPRTSGGDELRAAEVRRLVWAAADAPRAGFAEALDELRGFPGVGWREVYDVLAGGRDYTSLPPPPAPVDELSDGAALRDLTAAMGRVPWTPGEVQVLDLGSAPEDWYRVRLPHDYDGDEAVPVLLDLGGIVARTESAAPDGFAVVTLNDLLFHVPELGGVPLNLTGGTASQTIVRSVIADLERRFHADRDRVFVAGFSRGGNAALYFAAHWPDLWAGAIPASGYYPVERDTWGNAEHVAFLAVRGTDRFHKGANDFMRQLGKILRRNGHEDLTEHAGDGRAVGPELRELIHGWLATRRRVALPDDVSLTWRDPRHTGAYWVEILEADDTGGTRPVVIGAPGNTAAERFPVHRKPSTVRVRRIGPNEVRVDARNVARLRLAISPAQFDLSEPLRVRIAGRTQTIRMTPTVSGLLRRFRQDRDRHRLFPATVDLEL